MVSATNASGRPLVAIIVEEERSRRKEVDSPDLVQPELDGRGPALWVVGARGLTANRKPARVWPTLLRRP
jgi:hypothetical protein